MRKYSLAKTILKTRWLGEGLIEAPDGSILKCFEVEPLSAGLYEESFEGPNYETVD